jgi:hypothetical protein
MHHTHHTLAIHTPHTTHQFPVGAVQEWNLFNMIAATFLFYLQRDRVSQRISTALIAAPVQPISQLRPLLDMN